MNKLNVAVKQIEKLEAELKEHRLVIYKLMTDSMSYAYYEGNDPGGKDGGWVAYNHKTKERYKDLPDKEQALILAGLSPGDTVSQVSNIEG